MTLTHTQLTQLLREPDAPIAALYAAISSRNIDFRSASDADVRSAILAAPLGGPRRAAVVACQRSPHVPPEPRATWLLCNNTIV